MNTPSRSNNNNHRRHSEYNNRAQRSCWWSCFTLVEFEFNLKYPDRRTACVLLKLYIENAVRHRPTLLLAAFAWVTLQRLEPTDVIHRLYNVDHRTIDRVYRSSLTSLDVNCHVCEVRAHANTNDSRNWVVTILMQVRQEWVNDLDYKQKPGILTPGILPCTTQKNYCQRCNMLLTASRIWVLYDWCCILFLPISIRVDGKRVEINAAELSASYRRLEASIRDAKNSDAWCSDFPYSSKKALFHRAPTCWGQHLAAARYGRPTSVLVERSIGGVLITSVKQCFRMMFDNICQMTKNIAASMLLLMLVMVFASSASPLSRCGENQFFDRHAQICTNCDEICNPLRGTQYLCDRYADECRPRKYKSFTRLNIENMPNKSNLAKAASNAQHTAREPFWRYKAVRKIKSGSRDPDSLWPTTAYIWLGHPGTPSNPMFIGSPRLFTPIRIWIRLAVFAQ